MKQIGEYIIAFLTGFFLYGLLEIAGRGYTHWTMTLMGGTVLCVLYHMEGKGLRRVENALFGAIFVTAAEFTVGVLDNLIMGWEVWDYSDVPLNLYGQICLPFSILWFILCVPASFLCSAIFTKYHPKSVHG